jgi:hypothetical protein
MTFGEFRRVRNIPVSGMASHSIQQVVNTHDAFFLCFSWFSTLRERKQAFKCFHVGHAAGFAEVQRDVGIINEPKELEFRKPENLDGFEEGDLCQVGTLQRLTSSAVKSGCIICCTPAHCPFSFGALWPVRIIYTV